MVETTVVNLKTPEGRVSFPSVFEPSDYSDKYELTLIFPKDTDLSALKQAARDAAFEKWGKNPPKGLKNPFRKVADKLETYGEDFDSEGIFLTFRSANRPGLVDATVDPIMDQSEFYPGCWAKVSTNAFAWEHRVKNAVVSRGVSFGLNNIQKVRDDDPLAGNRVKAEDDFDPLEGSSGDPGAYDGDDDIFGPAEGSDEDLTAEDDDIPF